MNPYEDKDSAWYCIKWATILCFGTAVVIVAAQSCGLIP